MSEWVRTTVYAAGDETFLQASPDTFRRWPDHTPVVIAPAAEVDEVLELLRQFASLGHNMNRARRAEAILRGLAAPGTPGT